MSCDPIIQTAADAVGGKGKLSATLGLTRAAVYLWRRVPSQRVIQVEQATGIHRSKLRPDLYPPEAA